jgi:DNA-binding NarL/FixJ family response regulator
MVRRTNSTKPTNGKGIVRIAIADGHALFRDAVRSLLETEPDFRVVGEAVDGLEAACIVRNTRPDILLMELAMPRYSGLETLSRICAFPPLTRPLLLVAGIENEQLIEALQLGACGLVLKTATTSQLVKGIRSVMTGEYWLGRDCVPHLVRALCDRRRPENHDVPENGFGLTLREHGVVAASVAGLSIRDIAQNLGRSESTIKHRLTGIFRKLGVSNRLELVMFAANHNLAVNGTSALNRTIASDREA